MTTLVLAAVLATVAPPPQLVKYMTLDDFTVGAYTKTLQFGQSDYHVELGLDKLHCLFGERRTWTGINSNPNNTTLTLSIGSGEQRLASPAQVAWHYYLEYGNDGLVNLDLSQVRAFYLDMHAVGGSYIPDSMTLGIHDAQFRGGTVGMLGRIGGVYFDKKYFPPNMDWHHITYLRLLQDFDSLPNPTLYSATKFYASISPELSPGEKIDPTAEGG